MLPDQTPDMMDTENATKIDFINKHTVLNKEIIAQPEKTPGQQKQSCCFS